jgi:cytochrome b
MAWDRVVRGTHWAVATLVAFNLLNEEGARWHRWAGYTVVGLVLVRLAWGLWLAPAGSAARLASWWPRPRAVWAHLQTLIQGHRDPHGPGHNPLGACMVLVFWCVLLGLGTSGWMMQQDAWWGEDWLEDLHEGLATALWGLVPLHVLGALLEGWRVRRNLVRDMIRERA